MMTDLTQKLPMSGESMEEVNTELDKLDNVLEVFTNIIIIAIFFIVTVLKISTIILISLYSPLFNCAQNKELEFSLK